MCGRCGVCGVCIACPCPQSVELSQQVVRSLRSEVRDAALSSAQRIALHKAIDNRFKVSYQMVLPDSTPSILQ